MNETKTKRIRIAFDKETMGFGKHKYEYIDPKTIDHNKVTEPPNGVRTREFSVAFNKKAPGNDMTIDLLSRPGVVFETDAEGFAGRWVTVKMPALRSAVMYAVCSKVLPDALEAAAGEAVVEISAVKLGVVPDRFTNNYEQAVTKWVGGKKSATGEDRARLTKLP